MFNPIDAIGAVRNKVGYMDIMTLPALSTLERQGWDALCNQTGSSFYGSLMTEDAVMVLVNGFTMDRDTVVASLDQAPAWDSYTISDERIVRVGAEATALVYRATAQRAGEEPFEAIMTSVYVKSTDGPRLALYTQTTATHASDAERNRSTPDRHGYHGAVPES